MGYRLRPATERDRDWLDDLRRAVYARLFQATWGRWDEDRHCRHFDATWQRGGIQVIEQHGQPVGMLQLLDGEDGLEVAEIQLLPAHQNLGLGTAVLADVLEQADRQGRDVFLSTGLRNTDACRLYRRLGFEETGRTDAKVHMRRAARRR